MVITSIEPFKGEALEITLDGQRKIFLNKSVAQRNFLEKNSELSEEDVERLAGENTLRKAKKRALYLLGERAYCSGELFKKLEKTYGADVAKEAVSYARGLGYLDDADYARKYAEHLVFSKKYGVRRARQQMMFKGLPRELCDEALGEISASDIDEGLISLIEKKYSEKLSDFDDRRRTTAALARRGYDFSAIKRCIGYVLQRREDEEFEDDDIEDLNEFED